MNRVDAAAAQGAYWRWAEERDWGTPLLSIGVADRLLSTWTASSPWTSFIGANISARLYLSHNETREILGRVTDE